MDNPALPHEDHNHALRGLARINALSRAWAPIARAIKPLATEPITILDVATGSADVPLALAPQFANATWSACDLSPQALIIAQAKANARATNLNLFTHDVVMNPFSRTFDVVLCSLFLHHLEPTDVTRVLQHMAAATRRLLVVHDLRRTRPGLALAHIVPKLLTRSHVVHIDAVKSVHAAYTIPELRTLAHDAGLTTASIEPTFPQRMLLTWKPGGSP